MKKRNKPFLSLIGTALLLVAGLALVIREHQLAQERRLHEGHSIREWVQLALADHSVNPGSAAARMVSRIGPPAVPHLIEILDHLRASLIHERLLLWQINHLPTWCQWLDAPPDVSGDVVMATQLLTGMGEAARPAVPAIIRSSDQIHYWAHLEILDDLAEMGPVASAAVPWLQQLAANGEVRAAWSLSHVSPGDDTLTRVIVRAIQEERKPSDADRELFWLRDDTELNLKLVPLLAELLGSSSVAEDERLVAAHQLGCRGMDARPALPLMRTAAAQTDSAALRAAITQALEAIGEAEAAARTNAPVAVESK